MPGLASDRPNQGQPSSWIVRQTAKRANGSQVLSLEKKTLFHGRSKYSTGK
jgi:hypothetical protein